MIPLLFESSATAFTSHGIGPLTEASSCEVTKNGMQYELQMSYPVSGRRYGELMERRIIYAKPDQIDDPQPFRIYRISKPVNGTISIFARHISYDLTGIPVTQFAASSPTSFAALLKSNEAVNSGFTFSSNISDTYTYENKTPTSSRSLITKWQETYGGELKFDGFSVQLLSAAGQDRGVIIRYGVDLIDAQMEQNISEVYTGILPYYVGKEDVASTQTQIDVQVVGTPQYPNGQTPEYIKLMPVDVSQYIAETPTQSQVDNIGQQWLLDNNIRKPVLNLQLSYAQIGNRIVQQYDTVKVEIEKLGLIGDDAINAKITKTVFDVLRERYSAVEVGDARPTLSGDIYDASRLHKGLLPVERIADKSLTASKYADGSVGSSALASWAVEEEKLKDLAVTVNKIKDGAVITAKIADSAVETDKIADAAINSAKVLDQAITLAKMWPEFQVFYADIIAAMAIYANYLRVNGALECSVLYLRAGYLVSGAYPSGEEYRPIGITDHLYSANYSLSGAWGGAYDSGGDYYEFPLYALSGGLTNSLTLNWTAFAKVNLEG